ncbi:nitroreductase family deazaflavin-dependent oxidoreductase [Nocardia cyriacigeorgica]|uniref:Nitroreductase family deazaflavin-dependent oxidoreductase n=1 Tax=Nocardia cyriacigeorgica TaxID=135487 RepID=A0A5R8PEU0_9NOCA|nr:nitroreductase family deazaflavin-dependent oxidoreductase [Nocardia cyriacigeorgica]TLG10900.1 nitroreductase family deazaflavin-dependent oxidoreductase [Nocardia cyriacigeorgica]
MTGDQQVGGQRKPGTPGPLSRWFQKKMNARTAAKMRRKGSGKVMGMNVLILHTIGRRSGERRETPLAWFGDGDAKLIVASGGGSVNPDWYANLTAHPEQVSIELPGEGSFDVTPQTLDGTDREDAWKRIVAEEPRIGKYQKKSKRIYPVVRLSPR